jgi:radical SAM superfamily enzyme YgiQ (UPF0313 family)
MAKLLMIQIQSAPYCGTAYLNAAAKSRHHTFSLLLSNSPSTILSAIQSEKPDIIGFSCLSCFMKEILSLCDEIKKTCDIPIVLGGPHPTLFPEVIHEKSIDIICLGEGEFALIDLLNAIEHKKTYSHIKNLWVKKRNTIYKNPLRPLVEPLDRIPLIDWSCYTDTPVLYGSPTVFLIRGCPFSCNYCFNQKTKELYHNLGSYIRHFSVDRSILEIKAALKYFPKDPIIFASDSFGIDLPWMEEVFAKYSKLTNLPFVLLLRPELTTQRCIDILAKYNCCSVSIGVESGSERIRRDIIHRYYTNTYLIDMANRLHAKKIKFKTFNMLGLPTETEKEMWETVDINVKMKTDFPRASIFTPYPGTEIVEIAKKKGYLSKNYNFDNLPDTILDHTILKKLDAKKVQNMLFFFQTAIKFPRIQPLIRTLTNIKPNFIFRLYFYTIYALVNGIAERRNMFHYIPYLFANRRYR